MVFEKIIGSLNANHGNKEVVKFPYDWYEASKRILKRQASTGEAIGIRIEEDLYDGALLFEDDKRVIVLDLKPCEVISINVSNMKEMGKVCFELGNRHIPLTIVDNNIKTPYDSANFEYMQKKGFICEKLTEKFVPEFVVKGHGHHSDSDYKHHITGIGQTGTHHHGGGFAY